MNKELFEKIENEYGYGSIYIFETLEELVEMLKDEGCKLTLNIKEKVKLNKL